MWNDAAATQQTAAANVWSSRQHSACKISQVGAATSELTTSFYGKNKLIIELLWQSNSNNASTSTIISDTPPIYNSPPRPEYCANCGMELATEQDMKRHLEQHETCPADDCDFAALANVLERHIEAHHITGLYKSVKKVWTPEDIAAWRAERRKKLVLF